jgi:hypothetical protein
LVANGRVFDAPQGALESEGLEQAVKLAKQEGQFVVWDLRQQPWAIAVYEFRTKKLHPLLDEEAAVVSTVTR